MFCASALESGPTARHGFFSRRGGVSEGLYESLNCGFGTADDPERVKENRARIAAKLDCDPDRLVTAYQVHSPNVVVADKPWGKKVPEADAIVTKEPGLAVGVLTADCAPLLLCDPGAGIVAAAHAGWRGTLDGIVENTLATMEGLGGDRRRIVAAIGPAISQSAYEVETDFAAQFAAKDPASADFFRQEEQPHFDLAGYVAYRLEQAGVEAPQLLHLCTYCDESRFFSYRRSQHHGEPDYGRQISAILLA
jgi:polyphenol oxidase